jgi:hypothetical protein
MNAEIRGRNAFDVLVEGRVVHSTDSLEQAVALRTVIASLGWGECRRIFGQDLVRPEEQNAPINLAQYKTPGGERAMLDEVASMIATSNIPPRP